MGDMLIVILFLVGVPAAIMFFVSFRSGDSKKEIKENVGQTALGAFVALIFLLILIMLIATIF